MRRTCPDLAQLMAFLKTNQVPLIGVSVTPSFRTEGKVQPRKPRIGFVLFEKVKQAAQACGIDPSYLPKPRRERPADAFRCAIAAVASDREFKDRGYRMDRWLKKDGWVSPNPCYVVQDTKRADVDRQYKEDGTIQSIVFDLDTQQIHTEVESDQHYIVVAGKNRQPLITPSVTDYYRLFGHCCTTQDVSHMVAKLLTDHCWGVPLRKGGGQYFIPRDDSDPNTINPRLDQVQEFVELVRQAGGAEPGIGGVGCHWTPFPLLDYQEVRTDLTAHVQAELASRVKEKVDDVEGMVRAITAKGKEAVRDTTKNKRLAEFAELESQARLLERVLGTKLETIRSAIKYNQNVVQELLTGQARPEEVQEETFDLAAFLMEDEPLALV